CGGGEKGRGEEGRAESAGAEDGEASLSRGRGPGSRSPADSTNMRACGQRCPFGRVAVRPLDEPPHPRMTEVFRWVPPPQTARSSRLEAARRSWRWSAWPRSST